MRCPSAWTTRASACSCRLTARQRGKASRTCSLREARRSQTTTDHTARTWDASSYPHRDPRRERRERTNIGRSCTAYLRARSPETRSQGGQDSEFKNRGENCWHNSTRSSSGTRRSTLSRFRDGDHTRRPVERRTSTPRSKDSKHRGAQTPQGTGRHGRNTARPQHSQKRQKRGQQAAGSMSETPSTREDQEGARVPMTQGRRQRPTPHAPPRTRDARARTRTTPCSGRGCEIAWIKGSVDAAEAGQSSGRKGGVLPCPGLPPLAGREGAWRGVLADQGGTRNSVSRSSINLVPSLVYR